MTEKGWQNRWEAVRALGKGGQGTTSLVRSRGNPDACGVLKTLVPKKERDPKARARMHQEVTNLQILAAAGASVPNVLDGNTCEFTNLDESLYFVMEFIPGDTLDKFLTESGLRTPDEAIDLALSICNTVRVGHENRVLHRDIKPKNLIVRDSEARDIWVVDYGLSFNEDTAAESELTADDEKVGNLFTDLPERRTPGAQRRVESDLSAICGILYYSITGKQPVPLRDANGDPPHKRTGQTICQSWPDYPYLDSLDSLLDRGFQHDLVDRFHDVSELIARLEAIRSGKPTRPVEDLPAFLKEASGELRRRSRSSLLMDFREKSLAAVQKIVRSFQRAPSAESFVVLPFGPGLRAIEGSVGRFSLPEKLDDLDIGVLFQVGAVGFNAYRAIMYSVGSQAKECVVLRRRMIPDRDVGGAGEATTFSRAMGPLLAVPGRLRPVDDWIEVLWYQGSNEPSTSEILADINESVAWAAKELIAELSD